MAIKPAYQFEEHLLGLKFKIFPTGRKYRIESESFPNFASARYASLDEAKETLGTIILTRYACASQDYKEKFKALDGQIKRGQTRMNKKSSLDSWLENLNRAGWEF